MLLMMNGGKCPLTFHHYESDARRRGVNKLLTTIAAGDYAVFRKHGSKMDQRGTITSIFLYLAAPGGKEAQHLSGLGGADIALIANVWCGAQHTMAQVVRGSAHSPVPSVLFQSRCFRWCTGALLAWRRSPRDGCHQYAARSGV